MDERIKAYETKMSKSYDSLLKDFSTIRAGRANPNVLDKITVDYYGTPTPLQQVGNITVPEARILMIQPWEKKMIREIEKAIMVSDIGINPTNDGTCIRLVFPELTEDRRKDLAKEVKKKGEGAKVAVRNIRRDANDAFKKPATYPRMRSKSWKITFRSSPISISKRSTRQWKRNPRRS